MSAILDMEIPVKKSKMGRLAAASIIGTTLEWYDFTIYNLMAALVFNVVFFPKFDPLTGTILAFSTYAVGYVSRPLGGIIFGHLGDKKGRRFVLVTTLLMMGLATGLMGLLPTYDALGIWSPLLLVALRFVQGAAIGGEWAGSVLLSMEHGSDRKRGLNASFTQLGPSCGTLLGTALVTVITLSMTSDQFQAWGWRIPFLASIVLVLFGLWLRSGVEETPVFKALEVRQAKAKAPLKEVFTVHWRRLLLAGGARLGVGVLYGLVAIFSLTYVTTVLHLPRPLALTATMVGAAFNALTMPMFGALSDRIGRRPVYAIGAVLGLIWAFVYFQLMNTSQPLLICAAMVGGLVIHAMMFGPQAAFVTEQFPTRVRYAGSSLAYTLAGLVADAFAPLIIVTLYKAYGSTTPISLYICLALSLTLIALFFARETAGKPLES